MQSGGSSAPTPPWLAYNADASEITAADLEGLTNGAFMFYGSRFASFSSDLPNLTNGDSMFYRSNVLTSFSGKLSALTNGTYMFYQCPLLDIFSSDLLSLVLGEGMFFACAAMSSFSGKLSALTNGRYMFADCSSLASFSCDLPSLSTGLAMFRGCVLDKVSALRILNTIPAYTSGDHPLTLGMAASLNGDADIAAALTAASEKGWTVTAQYN